MDFSFYSLKLTAVIFSKGQGHIQIYLLQDWLSGYFDQTPFFDGKGIRYPRSTMEYFT
jgi:hypothetical protein